MIYKVKDTGYDTVGVFITDGDRVDYIGRHPTGWYWFWSFIKYHDDVYCSDFFDTIFNNSKYECEGFLAAFYDNVNGIAEEFKLELDEDI